MLRRASRLSSYFKLTSDGVNPKCGVVAFAEHVSLFSTANNL